jgi:hypothetical protein
MSQLPVDYSGVVNMLVREALDYEGKTGMRARRIVVAPDVREALLTRLKGQLRPLPPSVGESAIDPDSLTLHGFAIEVDEYAPPGFYEADDLKPHRHRRGSEGGGGFSLASIAPLMAEYGEKMLALGRSEERRSHPFLTMAGKASNP